MLAQTLQMMIDKQWTHAREIGELAGVSTSTVYRWINGQSQPDFDSVRLLVRLLPNPQAQKALLSTFAAGTAWTFTSTQLELDVNQDGQVDAEDALDASCQTVKTAGQSLIEVRDACRGKRLTADDTIALIAQLNHVVGQCTITQRILVEMAEARRKRKLKLAD